MHSKVLLFNIKKIKNRNLFVYDKLKFIIKRFYFHNELKKGYKFGFHSHKKLRQIYICVYGAVKITVFFNNKKKIFLLNKETKGLFIQKNVWREIETISNNSVLCTLADQKYKKNDYIRNFDEFKKKNKVL